MASIFKLKSSFKKAVVVEVILCSLLSVGSAGKPFAKSKNVEEKRVLFTNKYYTVERVIDAPPLGGNTLGWGH